MPPRSTGLPTRLQEQDRVAWDEVYREYEERLYRFAYRLTGNEHDAADLVQETFVRVLQRLDQLDRDRPDLSSYLFKTVQNLFLRGRERARRVEAVEEVPEPREPMAIEDDPHRATLLHRQQEEVRIANGKLAPRQRLALALCELEDKSYGEIGELVGLNENAVAQLISRARQSLRHELRLVQVDRSKLPEECQRFLPLLSTYLDGQLQGEKKDDVLLHLAACEHCPRALADMEDARRRYRALIPPLAGAGALKEGIDAALAAEGFWNGGGRSALGHRLALAGRPRAWLLAAVAGIALLAAAGGGYLALRGGETEPAAAVAEAVPESPRTQVGVEESDLPLETVVADTTSPSVAILNGPPGETRSRTASFSFESSEQGSVFACSLDGDPTQECASPAVYDGLAVGPHVFTVTAADAVGNESAPGAWEWTIVPKSADGEAAVGDETTGEDSPPADGETEPPADEVSPPATDSPPEVEESPQDDAKPQDDKPEKKPEDTKPEDTKPADTTPPSITALSGPPSPTRKTTAVIRWSTSEPVSSVECSLDGAGFVRCFTPMGYSGLSVGSHQFCVRAIDRAKNVGGASCYSWVVEEEPPPTPPETQPPPPETEPPPTEPPPTDPPPREPPPIQPPPECPPTSGPPPPGC